MPVLRLYRSYLVKTNYGIIVVVVMMIMTMMMIYERLSHDNGIAVYALPETPSWHGNCW